MRGGGDAVETSKYLRKEGRVLPLAVEKNELIRDRQSLAIFLDRTEMTQRAHHSATQPKLRISSEQHEVAVVGR